ncbi:MAG TPA: ABC transporter ATP-binding protein [Pyrinomonadaceae bacterium]|nr:ABC transporter ATP-binding protein [Pyrinomonadaceae bacterium]
MPGSHKILGSKLRKALAQLPNLPRALALVWQVARPWTIAWILLLIVQGLLPAALVFLTKLFVDALIRAARADWPEMQFTMLIVLLIGGVLLLMEVVRNAINWVRTVQAELLQDHITALIHEKSVAVDLAFYELSDYYDHLHRARAEARYRPVALLGNLGALLQNSITLVAMGAILIPLGPGLAVALLLSTLPAFFVVVYYALAEYQWRQRTTADDRRAGYYDWIMTTAEAAAEIRLFGLGKYFQSNHKRLRGRLRNERLQLTRRQGLAELAASLIALVIMGLALALMVWRTLMNVITPGELAMICAAFNQGQGLMRTLLENAGQLYGNSLFLGNLFEFLALQPTASTGDARLRDIERGIKFNDVSFSYPDAATKALDNFTMIIPRGKIVAIVGPNGAGKSTLLKLLCRFYDPSAGSITLDDRDLKDFAIDDLRRLITVLFQQPFHYNTTVRQNISFGDLKLVATDAEINSALRAAGAEEIVARLPRQEQTLLGRWFVGGTELSVGEWQRIALARAFLRRAPIIVLDEPTSALDPWAEADWLERFRQLASGRTSIIITHRFTTAMHADVIHVMDRGRIVESGSHQNLLNQNGLYSESWSRQMMSAAYAESV